MSTEQKVPQIQMVWPESRLTQRLAWKLPEGYFMRQYRPEDFRNYVRLMDLAGFTGWTEKNVDEILQRALPNGFFVVEHAADGRLAATANAQHKPTALHPFGAELGWVAGDPAHKGKGLGYAVCCAAVQRAIDGGYSRIYLLTDDFRLPAIKIYLKMGFRPFLFDNGMEERWRAVCEKLGVDYEKTMPVR